MHVLCVKITHKESIEQWFRTLVNGGSGIWTIESFTLRCGHEVLKVGTWSPRKGTQVREYIGRERDWASYQVIGIYTKWGLPLILSLCSAPQTMHITFLERDKRQLFVSQGIDAFYNPFDPFEKVEKCVRSVRIQFATFTPRNKYLLLKIPLEKGSKMVAHTHTIATFGPHLNSWTSNLLSLRTPRDRALQLHFFQRHHSSTFFLVNLCMFVFELTSPTVNSVYVGRKPSSVELDAPTK